MEALLLYKHEVIIVHLYLHSNKSNADWMHNIYLNRYKHIFYYINNMLCRIYRIDFSLYIY